MSERWTPKKKKKIVKDLMYGKIDREDIYRVSDISEDELNEWIRKYNTPGLRLVPRVIDGYRP